MMASISVEGQNTTAAQAYVRWHFPVGCALLLSLTLVAFWDNLVSDVGQPSNSNPVTLVHGLFLLAWMILLLTQSLLARFGRTSLHRAIGPYGFAVGAGVVASTLWLFATVWKGWAALTPEVLANRLFLPTFAAYVLAAYRQRRSPDVHKRLVYCGTLLLSEPVLARTFDPLVVPFLPSMPPGVDMPIFYAYMVVVWTGFFIALAAYDWLSRKRIHPVTSGSLAWLYAVTPLPLPFRPRLRPPGARAGRSPAARLRERPHRSPAPVAAP